jgi:uncharacterized protein
MRKKTPQLTEREKPMRFKTLLLAGAGLLLSSTAYAEDSINVCSGKPEGNYNFAVEAIKQQAQGSGLTINNVNTKGSWENLQKLASGECDAAIVQSDAYGVWNSQKGAAALNLDRVDVLYPEYVHLFCNRQSGIDAATDLAGNKDVTVAIGENGSGSAVTWAAMGLEDDSYAKVSTLPLGGKVALVKVKAGTDVQCAVYVGGLNSGYMKEVDKYGQDIALIDFDDKDFNDAEDPKGNDVYEFVEINQGTYPGIQGGWSDIDTITVQATLVLNTSWIEQHSDGYEQFIDFQLKAQPAIKTKVGAQ